MIIENLWDLGVVSMGAVAVGTAFWKQFRKTDPRLVNLERDMASIMARFDVFEQESLAIKGQQTKLEKSLESTERRIRGDTRNEINDLKSDFRSKFDSIKEDVRHLDAKVDRGMNLVLQQMNGISGQLGVIQSHILGDKTNENK